MKVEKVRIGLDNMMTCEEDPCCREVVTKILQKELLRVKSKCEPMGLCSHVAMSATIKSENCCWYFNCHHALWRLVRHKES